MSSSMAVAAAAPAASTSHSTTCHRFRSTSGRPRWCSALSSCVWVSSETLWYDIGVCIHQRIPFKWQSIIFLPPGAHCHPQDERHAQLDQYLPNEPKYRGSAGAARLYANGSGGSKLTTRSMGAGRGNV